MNQEHPKLFFDRDGIERFRVRLTGNVALSKEWDKWLDSAGKLVAEPFIEEAYADEVDSQHGRYFEPANQIQSMGIVLGTAYQVTGEKKYANKLREGLLYYAQYRKWHGKGLARNEPPWHSELSTTKFCYGFAVGYDCIYDVLDEDDREVIRRSVVGKGILPILQDWIMPETRIHAMDSMGHNWWSVCVSQAGLAVLSVLGEEPRAEGWLERILSALPEYFRYQGSVLGNKSPNFDDKGAFYESVHYAHYGLYEFLEFHLAYRHMSGGSADLGIPMLHRVGSFFLNTFYPSSHRHLTVNFGDGDMYNHVGKTAKLLLANGFEDPGLRWYLKEHGSNIGYDAYDFFFHQEIREGEARPPEDDRTSVIYNQIGWAVLRTGWDRDATLLAVKSGFTWNHAHADAGSFILFHQGMPVLIDSGTCSYGRSEYKDYCQSNAHNVVLFNGKGQDPEDLYRGGKEPGYVYHLIDHDGLRYVYADAAGPMSRYFSRNFRHFLCLEDCILIFDDVLAHEEGRMQWLLHYDGNAMREDNGDIRIANGKAGAIVRSLLPTGLYVMEGEGLTDHDPDRKRTYFSIETPDHSREAKFLTAVILLAGQSGESGEPHPCPEVTAWKGEESIGATIVYQGKRTDVYINCRADGRIMHQNSILTMGGWETDAYMLAVTRAVDSDADDIRSVERCFLSYGSYLRRNSSPVISSLSKVTLAYSASEEELNVSVCGQPEVETELFLPIKPSRLLVNKLPVEPRSAVRGGSIKIRLSAGTAARRPG